MQFLQLIGVVLFFVGILSIIVSKIPNKTVAKSVDFHRQLTGTKTEFDRFASPSFSSELNIKFNEKPQKKILLTLEHIINRVHGGFVLGDSITKFETTQIIPRGIITQKKVKFSLDSDTTCQYHVSAKVIDALKKEGHEKILNLFKECGFNIQSQKKSYILSDVEGEKFDVDFDDFLKEGLHLLYNSSRGNQLYNIFKIKKYQKAIDIWHKKHPDLLDKIADIVKEDSEKIEVKGSIEILKVDYPLCWLFHIGLTILTISVVIYFAK